MGDHIEIARDDYVREVEVKALLKKRVGAKLVPSFLNDHTPPERIEEAIKARRAVKPALPQREAGSGRPTKRERRELDQLMEDSLAEQEAFDEFIRAFRKR